MESIKDFPLSLVSIVSILPLSLFLFAFLRRKGLKDGRRLPPGKWGLPLIGNLPMLGELPHRTLQRWAKRYGDIMSIRLGQVQTVVVSSPEAAQLFLRTHDSVFASRPKIQASVYMSYDTKGLGFAPYGPYWRNLKKLYTLQLLSASRAESFVSMREEELGSFVDSIKEAADEKRIVDLSAKVSDIVESLMCRMVLGQPGKHGVDFISVVKELVRLAGAFNLADFVPYLAPFDLQGLGRKMKARSKAMDNVLEQILDKHIKDGRWKKENHQKDFVDILLSMMNKPMNPQSSEDPVHILDLTTIKAIIMDMIVGAFETSSTTIEWALSEILKHPNVMTQLQQELQTVVGMDRIVKETDLLSLKYLDMVIKESLRLHPTAPFLIPRESMEDIAVKDYYVPKGTRILINTWAIGMDSNTWSGNIDQFYPERFKNSSIDLKGHDFQLLPFGSGRRGCPGLQLGLTTVRLVIAELVHCFDWKLPNDMLHSELDMREVFGLSMRRASHLLAVPSFRLH